ncbi:hypothetical protein G9C85_09325 [Halorubellus sp. JP-L1]|uniref:hypothetical protein n=1 Tax=Halorubellus sp. JP-L1 TaxID=2715753 RepID=UPI00140A4543|nr:hypothetical protein [Halorubellus sp. JP-L1]NHN41829.1 hypothetical protein [Halorubellus sp. JP-L1]
MSDIPTIGIDEFDGTHGYVNTKAFVNYEIDIDAFQPRQKVMLGDSELGDVQRPCVVYSDDITLEEGCGYRFGGIDYAWDDGEEIQLCLGDNGWVDKFYDPRES